MEARIKHILSKCNVLHLEPDGVFAEALDGLLRECRTGSVRHSSEIGEQMLGANTDLIIIDLDKDMSSSARFISKVRCGQTIADPSTIIIATQQHVMASKVKDELRIAFDFLLIKPFSLEALVTHLTKLLNVPRMFIFAEDYVGPYRAKLDSGHLLQQSSSEIREVSNRLLEKELT